VVGLQRLDHELPYEVLIYSDFHVLIVLPLSQKRVILLVVPARPVLRLRFFIDEVPWNLPCLVTDALSTARHW
jgi:hypothetical protein